LYVLDAAAIQLFSMNNIFPKKNYEITVVLLWRRFIFPDLIYKDGPLNMIIPIVKYIFGIEA
jgi:hypothetical protein